MFTDLKSLKIPQGDVVKIECNGSLIWEEPSSYTNQVSTSIDTDKNILNGVGYVGKTRLSSSGSTKANANYCSTSGFISAKSRDVIRVPSEYFEGGSCYVCSYDLSFGFLAAVNYNGGYGGGTVVTNGSVKEITLLNNSNIAYVRVSMQWGENDTGWNDSTADERLDGPCGYMLVTVNEEITD